MRLFFLLCFLNLSFLFSQEKIEREYRVKPNKVPEKAKQFIEKINFDSKLKWYSEENQNGKAFELKSYKNKRKFSIKFLPSGALVDVEKQLKIKELPKLHEQNITNALTDEFKKYRIKKIQIQWKSDAQNILKHIENKKTDFSNAIYEIIIIGKKNNTYKQYEILIKHNGIILQNIPLSKNHNDNLEF